MEWKDLISSKRLGSESESSNVKRIIRSEYERDYDRIIFSNAFKRLQNKTQVFPCPGKYFVHNRLTHSLEVSCVGRALGKIVGTHLYKKYKKEWDDIEISPLDIAHIVSCASLVHDIGNPPFGHSGEDAIRHFFRQHEDGFINFKLSNGIENILWKDLDYFEGNAQGFRVLTNINPDKLGGGLGLTYSTLGTYLKYPQEASAVDPESKNVSRKKYSFNYSEREIFLKIARKLKLIEIKSNPIIYCRHPLAFLMEAADDICNVFLDFEDSVKLGIIKETDYEDPLINIVTPGFKLGLYNKSLFNKIKDKNERYSFLRAKAMDTLVNNISDIFLEKEEKILNNEFDKPLISKIEPVFFKSLKEIDKVKRSVIFKNRNVLEIETAGYEILGGLLNYFIDIALVSKYINQGKQPTLYGEKLINLIPPTFYDPKDNNFQKVIKIVDYVTGMTDVFALDLYRKLKGISLPNDF
ncbi:MAG TPA: dNTP triphosphohydrolase [Ignavibacteria bacterium]